MDAIVPWVGYDYRGKGNADKTIIFYLKSRCEWISSFFVRFVSFYTSI